ncbi:MAG: hypothetical protein COT39_04385 [Parcubacteria group bacterium CG08_land_8_20_14_0_20_48_21]|nr:MAG: hypothetical protein AUK21_01335 [Parcubacteria group bacterium CG2_30_48_51]PIS32448.1 MAG: hypothetical protein COT39_04385 [Parcubacteria group bacterium CG08_land_8_20_14_0_20_48_21]PIW79594.1 MAG: hypothetical protein COZ99_00215 [Parcubacteria group bacterium CG_4_8_14_3_um_filter_48_16]PIY78041.1 MAG: hypothetical protein COY83_01855 [Parcubacteria group bacterium CG_4_10_14_0_8_um_filter_48_154]PIZ77936.1 MAG: hypothetical protein COY03_01155 [bacterium CG_4_10_14_0_2_um_filter_
MPATTPRSQITHFFKILGFDYLQDVKKKDLVKKMGELTYMRFMVRIYDKLSAGERKELTALFKKDAKCDRIAQFLYMHISDVDRVLADVVFGVQTDVKNDLAYITKI